MTYCEVCHHRIYTYAEFKIGNKTACYHCKIRDLENKIEAIKKTIKDSIDFWECMMPGEKASNYTDAHMCTQLNINKILQGDIPLPTCSEKETQQ